jgi:23S rRNA pseudouridine1911/1915/1917 synthase
MSRLRAFEVPMVRPADVAEGSVVSVFRVPPEVAGQRLDVFIQSQLHRTSRTRAQAIVRASAYDAVGRRLKPNDRVQPEQHIMLWRAPWDETAAPCDVPVLWEDEHLLAVSKPALLAVHPTARYHKNTLIKILQAARPDCPFLSLGHRLDRETSGVMLVSKTRECDRALKRQLEARDGIEKTYVAFTCGVPDRGDGAHQFMCERRVELDPTHPLRIKMRVREAPDALYAATFVDVKAVRRGSGEATEGGRTGPGTYAEVHCTLHTGRQHQIRLHLSSLGAPIVGDKLYGEDDSLFRRAADGELTDDDHARLEMARHALHAWRLSLAHPITGAPLELEAPLPPDMSDFWAGLCSSLGCP